MYSTSKNHSPFDWNAKRLRDHRMICFMARHYIYGLCYGSDTLTDQKEIESTVNFRSFSSPGVPSAVRIEGPPLSTKSNSVSASCTTLADCLWVFATGRFFFLFHVEDKVKIPTDYYIIGFKIPQVIKKICEERFVVIIWSI